jgi:lipoic acid synthetase
VPPSRLNPSRINQSRLAGIDTALPGAPAAGPWPTEIRLFTQMPVAEARDWQINTAIAMHNGTAPGHGLLITEHPPTFPNADPETLPEGWEIYSDRELPPGALYMPGMLTAWFAFHLDRWSGDRQALADALASLAMRVIKDFGIETARGDGPPDAIQILTADGSPLAWIYVTNADRVVQANLAINTNADPDLLEELGIDDSVSMTSLGMSVHRQDKVRAALLAHYETIFQSPPLIPQRAGVRTAKPPWLRVKLPVSIHTQPVHEIIKTRALNTVCESARCPNQGECWAHGTATFMVNGDVCTRSCSFCAVFTGRPKPIDPDEPRRVVEAARAMGLEYVVITAVNRDELPDGGAITFVRCIEGLREAIDGVKVEVLIPDFRGDEAALDAVFAARPDVLNHNVETVPRLYDRVRPQADYNQSLEVLARAKAAGLIAKSGFMLGLGEEESEVEDLLRDLRRAGVQIVTIGQYLRPSEYHHPVVRYATPTEFARWRQIGLDLGLATVQSGPLVRSSYHAHESFSEAQ